MQCSVHQSTCCRFEDVHATLLRWNFLPKEIRDDLQLIPIADSTISCNDANEALYIYRSVYANSPRIREAKRLAARVAGRNDHNLAVSRYEAGIRAMYPQQADEMLAKFHAMQRDKALRKQKLRRPVESETIVTRDEFALIESPHRNSQDSVNQHANQQVAEGVDYSTTPEIVEGVILVVNSVGLNPESENQQQDSVSQHANRPLAEGVVYSTTSAVSEGVETNEDHVTFPGKDGIDTSTVGSLGSTSRAAARSAFRVVARREDPPEYPEEEEYMEIAMRPMVVSNNVDSEYLIQASRGYPSCTRMSRPSESTVPTSAQLLGLESSRPGRPEEVVQKEAFKAMESFVTHREFPVPRIQATHSRGPCMMPREQLPVIVSIFPPSKIAPNKTPLENRDNYVPPHKRVYVAKPFRESVKLSRLKSSENAPTRVQDQSLSSDSECGEELSPILSNVKETHTKDGMRPRLPLKARTQRTRKKPRGASGHKESFSLEYVPSIEEELNQGISPDI